MSARRTFAAAAALAALAVSVLAGCGAARVIYFGERATSIKGTLDFRERGVLPPDAMIDVWLVDTTPVIQFTPLIAEATIRAGGMQPPIAFELPFDNARIVGEHSYGVRAAIRSGRKVLFETPGPSPVLTGGHPARADLALVRTAPESAATSPALVGTAWRLEDLAGSGVLDRVEATLEFPEAGRVTGEGSCNRYTGFFETSGGALTIARLGTTRKLCPPATMDQESRYLRALEGAERYAIEGATALLVYIKGQERPLRFVRKGA
jgi:heat shock protein HslJ